MAVPATFIPDQPAPGATDEYGYDLLEPTSTEEPTYLPPDEEPPAEPKLTVPKTFIDDRAVTPPTSPYERTYQQLGYQDPFGAHDVELVRALYQQLPADIGKGLDIAGKMVKSAAVAPLFTAIGEPQLAAQEILSPVGLQGIVPGGEPDTGVSPYEAGQRLLSPALRLPSEVATGLLETAPRLAASAAMPEATPLVWGVTPEGFDVKQAAIATLLPGIGKWTGRAVEAVAKSLGVESEAANALINRLGGGLGAAGVLGVDQMRQISNLPADQQEDAWVEAVASTVSMAGLGMMGERSRAADRTQPTFERARAIGEATGELFPELTGRLIEPGRVVPEPRERLPKPTVPETGTAERPSSSEEIIAANATTIGEIQALFPGINREAAREMGRAAWGQWPPPEEPLAGGVPVEPTKPTPPAPAAAALEPPTAKRPPAPPKGEEAAIQESLTETLEGPAEPTTPSKAPKPISVDQFVSLMRDETHRPSNNDSMAAGMGVKTLADLEQLMAFRIEMEAQRQMLMKEGKYNEALFAGQKGTFAREAIETATKSGSWETHPSLPEERPLDWRKNPEVEKWLRKNGARIGIELPEAEAPAAAALEPKATPAAALEPKTPLTSEAHPQAVSDMWDFARFWVANNPQGTIEQARAAWKNHRGAKYQPQPKDEELTRLIERAKKHPVDPKFDLQWQAESELGIRHYARWTMYSRADSARIKAKMQEIARRNPNFKDLYEEREGEIYTKEGRMLQGPREIGERKPVAGPKLPPIPTASSGEAKRLGVTIEPIWHGIYGRTPIFRVTAAGKPSVSDVTVGATAKELTSLVRAIAERSGQAKYVEGKLVPVSAAQDWIEKQRVKLQQEIDDRLAGKPPKKGAEDAERIREDAGRVPPTGAQPERGEGKGGADLEREPSGEPSRPAPPAAVSPAGPVIPSLEELQASKAPLAARGAAHEYHINQKIIETGLHPDGKKATPAFIAQLKERQKQVIENFNRAMATNPELPELEKADVKADPRLERPGFTRPAKPNSLIVQLRDFQSNPIREVVLPTSGDPMTDAKTVEKTVKKEILGNTRISLRESLGVTTGPNGRAVHQFNISAGGPTWARAVDLLAEWRKQMPSLAKPAAPGEDVKLFDQAWAAHEANAPNAVELLQKLNALGNKNRKRLMDVHTPGSKGGRVTATLDVTQWSNGSWSYGFGWDTEWHRGGTVWTGKFDSEGAATAAGIKAMRQDLFDWSRPHKPGAHLDSPDKYIAGIEKNNRKIKEALDKLERQSLPTLLRGEKLIDLPPTDIPLSAQRARLVKMLERLEDVDEKTGKATPKEGREESAYIVRERLHRVERELAGLPPTPYKEPSDQIKAARAVRAGDVERTKRDANEWIADELESENPPTNAEDAWMRYYTDQSKYGDPFIDKAAFFKAWNEATAAAKPAEPAESVTPAEPAPKGRFKVGDEVSFDYFGGEIKTGKIVEAPETGGYSIEVIGKFGSPQRYFMSEGQVYQRPPPILSWSGEGRSRKATTPKGEVHIDRYGTDYVARDEEGNPIGTYKKLIDAEQGVQDFVDGRDLPKSEKPAAPKAPAAPAAPAATAPAAPERLVAVNIARSRLDIPGAKKIGIFRRGGKTIWSIPESQLKAAREKGATLNADLTKSLIQPKGVEPETPAPAAAPAPAAPAPAPVAPTPTAAPAPTPTREELLKRQDLWTARLPVAQIREEQTKSAYDKLFNVRPADDPVVQDARAKWVQAKRNREKLEAAIRNLGADLAWMQYQEQVAPFRGPEGQAKVPKGRKTITAKTLKTQQEHLLDEVAKAIKEAPEESTEKITISVPGDGDFTVPNTKDTLKRFKALVEKHFPTSVPSPAGPEKPKGGKTIPKVTTPGTAAETAEVAGTFASTDPSRFVLLATYSDGTQIIGTDGRQLIRIVTPLAPGRPDAPVRLTPKGEIDTEAEGKYPNWKMVRDTNPDLVYGGLPTADLYHLAVQGQVFRNLTYRETSKRKGGIALYINPDRTLGARMELEGDLFEHNVQEKALNLGTYNPDYLLNAMEAARSLGNERVDVYFHGGEGGAIGFVGQNHESLTMPMRGETPTIRDDAKAFAGVKGSVEHPMPPEGFGPLENPQDAISMFSHHGNSSLQTTLEGDKVTFTETYEVKSGGAFPTSRDQTDTLGSITVEDWQKAPSGKRIGLISGAIKGNLEGRDVREIATAFSKDTARAFEERRRLEAEVEARKKELPPGPGAQTRGEPDYPAIEQLSDQLKAVPPTGDKEALNLRQQVAQAWGQGRSLTEAASGKLLAIGQSIKDVWRGVRAPTAVDSQIGLLDWMLQRSSAQSRLAGRAIKEQLPNESLRRAVALWIDTPGTPAEKVSVLRTVLARLPAQTPAHIRKAINQAIDLPEEGLRLASVVQQFYSIREQDAITHGIFGEMDQHGRIIKGGLDDYFTHVWGPNERNWPDDLRAAITNGRVNSYWQYARHRKIGQLVYGILQGKVPELDPAKVLPFYNYTLDRAIASRAFIKNLTDNVVGSDGRAALAPSGTINKTGDAQAPDTILINPRGRTDDLSGYRAIDHPSLRKWKWMTTDENGTAVISLNDLVVHPEFHERLSRFMDRSRLTPTRWGRKALRLSTEVKGFKLGLLSAFHQVHVGSHALWHWTSPFKFDDPNYFTRDNQINWDSPAVRFAVEKGHLKLAPDPNELNLFAEGLLSPGLVHKLPIVGAWSRAYSEFVFGEYIPKLKLKTFANALPRNQRWYAGKLTPDEIASRVGDAVNNAYGELNTLFLGKFGRDPGFQRLLRGVFLAPDFGEARLRFVEKTFTRFGMEERLAAATMVATLWLAARVANWATHGDPEVHELKRAFSVRVGDHWYSMRSVAGDVLHAFTDTGRFLYVRLNPLYSRTAADWLFGRDVSGRRLSPWEKFVERPLEQLVPIQFQGLTRDDQKLWESMLTSVGVGTQHASVEQDIREKSRHWMKSSGFPRAREEWERRQQAVYPESIYRPLRMLVQGTDIEAIRNEIAALVRKEPTRELKTKRLKSILEEFNPRTVTGKLKPFATNDRKFELGFLQSLDTRGKREYVEALAQQARNYQKIKQAVGINGAAR